MKILEAIYSFRIGGSERLAATLAERFAADGHQMRVMATHTDLGPISDQLQAQGIPCRGFGFEFRNRFSKYAFNYELYRYLKRERFDVVHAHHLFVFQRIYWPARLAGVRRIVLTEHSDHEYRDVPGYLETARRVAAKADCVTVIHERLRRLFIDEIGLPASRVLTVYNGVDTQRFTPAEVRTDLREQLGLPGGQIMFGWLGRMQPVKDLPVLIDAYARVCAEIHDGHRLVLIGDGPERSLIEAQCDRLGIRDRVHLLGARSDIPDLINNLDVVVSSSRLEGVPLVLLEAMSCGKPCIATAVGGIPEVLDSGLGMLVPAGDAAALAREMCQAIGSAGWRQTRGQASRNHVVCRFSLDIMQSEYLAAFAGGDLGSLSGVGDAIGTHG
ncbi:MAG: glycosyltransferase [Thiotrichales bacterium]